MKYLWLRPSACGKVDRAFGPARSSFIVSGLPLDSKALCLKLWVVLGQFKKWWPFVQKPIVELCRNFVVWEWWYVGMLLCGNGVMSCVLFINVAGCFCCWRNVQCGQQSDDRVNFTTNTGSTSLVHNPEVAQVTLWSNNFWSYRQIKGEEDLNNKWMNKWFAERADWLVMSIMMLMVGFFFLSFSSSSHYWSF